MKAIALGRLPVAMLAVILLCSHAMADLSVAVSQAKSVQTTTTEIITQVVADDGSPIGDPSREPGTTTTTEGPIAALITLDSDLDLKDIKNVQIQVTTATAKVMAVNPILYTIETPGSHFVNVSVFCLSPFKIQQKSFVVFVGKPEPPIPPKPDVSADRFDNIGQRVSGWAAGIPSRPAVEAVYRSHAALLRGDPSQTINSVSESLTRALAGIPDIGSYNELRKLINADLTQRWASSGLGRVDLADYYSAIANGLGGAK